MLVLYMCLMVWCCRAEFQRNRTLAGQEDLDNDYTNTRITEEIDSRYPKLFVLGVQKGGSSSLYDMLTRHPKLCSGVRKEPAYFKKQASFESPTGLHHYLSNYHETKSNGKCFRGDGMFVDATTMFHHLEVVMPRIYERYSAESRKKLRFIVLLREPVSRDFSWYQHQLRNDLSLHHSFRKVETFKEYQSKAVETGNRRSGGYAKHFEIFAKYFRRDQIFVVNSELCFNNSTDVMKRIAKFVGVEFIDAWKDSFPHDDHLDHFTPSMTRCVTAHIPKMDCSVRDEMYRYYKMQNEVLTSWMKKDGTEPPSEPAFIPFGQKALSLSCVEDSRADYDEYIDDCLMNDSTEKEHRKCTC